MLVAIEQRGFPTTTRSKSVEQRDRAFTLLTEAYIDARRAVLYLTSEAEADVIAPSLYAGRRISAEDEEDEIDEVPPVTVPADGSPSVSAPIAGGNGSAIDPALTKVGMPESNPFTE